MIEAETDRGATRRGVALVVAASLIVEIGAAVAKRLFDRAGPAGTVFLRLFFAAVILLAVSRPKIRGRAREDYVAVILFGLALGGMNLSFYSALDRLPLGVTVTIEFVGPLGVAVAGSRRAADVAWVLLAGIGVLLLSPISGAELDAVGVLLALVAGGCWASYILLSKKVGGGFEGLSGLALAMALAAVVMAGPGVAAAGRELINPTVLAIGLAVAILSSAIPYSLELMALRTLPARTFGVLMSLEMVMAALAGWVILSEGLGGRELVAIALVLLANVGAVRSSV